MKINRKYLISLFMILSCIFLYGCGTQNSNNMAEGNAEEASFTDYSDYEYYSVYYSYGTSEQWTVDRDGNTIPQNEVKYALRDLETFEVQAYYTTETVEIFPDDKVNYAYQKFLHTLYDTNGNVLREQAEENFMSGVGDYLIYNTTDDYTKRHLYNYKTGEMKEDIIGDIMVLGNGRYLLTDIYGAPYILADRDFNELKRFESEGRYYYWTRECKNGFFLSSYSYNEADRHADGGTTLFDSELKPAFDFTDVYLYRADNGIIGNYILIAFEEENLLKFADYDGNIVYELDLGKPGVEYFDGEILITHNSIEADYKNMYTMTNILTGEVLFERCRLITNLDGSREDRPAEKFMISWGDKVAVIDREGNILEEGQINDITYVHVLKDNLYLLYADVGNYESKDYLVDGSFDFVIEPEKYSYISFSRDYSKEGYPYIEYLRCGYNNRLTDICDFEGNVVIENIALIYDMGIDRISLRKGFYEGLMDYEGNWLAKESIFPKIAD